MTTSTQDQSTSEIAFKEWAGVCDALGTGKQILILRKGGIAEVEGGFQPDHETFWLYPTHVHESEQGLKAVTKQNPPHDSTTVEIKYLARVAWVQRVNDAEIISQIDTEHIWTTETALKRFYYRSPGVWLLCVRVYELAQFRRLSVLPEYLGCHTWVNLATPLETDSVRPVLSDEAFDFMSKRLQDRLLAEDSPRAMA